MTGKVRWVVWVSSEDSGEVSFYGLFHNYERAVSFADRINERIERERTLQAQSSDFWYATVRAVTPPAMSNVAAGGWVGGHGS